MNNWQTYFKGKRVTVMGLGLLGRSVGDIKFLAEQGAEIIVTDLKKSEELQTSIDQLKSFSNVTFVLGEHREEDFKDKDFILKSAGVPLESPYIAEARKNNIPIEMSTALFAAFTPATIIGITGTRGKSTVTHLIYEILKLAYEQSDKKIFLGGNVRGISTLPYLAEAKEGDIAVLELDSWQLQGFGERKISPNVSIFTTFMPDHLNYYKNNLKRYFEDKANIFINQKPEDSLIISSQISESPFFQDYKDTIKSSIIVADPSSIPEGTTISLPGIHNKMNIELACAAAKKINISDNDIKTGVETFPGVPGRLEKVNEVNGIAFYNDTNATTPDATIAALQALGSFKNITLIIGGADKMISPERLLTTIPTTVKNLILLPGTGTEKMKEDLKKLSIPLTEVESMKEAVEEAVKVTEKGEIILMSPGFASFGLFKNEYDRGDQFDEAVAKLLAGSTVSQE